MQIPTSCRRVVGVALVALTAGCVGGLGTVNTLGSIAQLVASTGRPGSALQQVRLTAEVRQVDVRRQTIQVETPDGRAGGVLFDLGTTVVHEHRPYPLNALREGDVVTLLLEDAPQNNLYARRIEVVRLAEPAPGAAPAAAEPVRTDAPTDTAELRTIEGEVSAIDADRGRFQLQTADGATLTVSLPFNPPAEVAERFERLRSGDGVRLEGHALGGGRLEVHRFTDDAEDPPAPSLPTEPTSQPR